MQGRVGWGLRQPNLEGGNTAHGRSIGARRSLRSILWLWFFPLGPHGKDGRTLLSIDKHLEKFWNVCCYHIVGYNYKKSYIFANLSRHRSIVNYQSFYHKSQLSAANFSFTSILKSHSPQSNDCLKLQLSFIKNKFSVLIIIGRQLQKIFC